MHVRAALTALSAAVVAIALAGCGSAPADVSAPGPGSSGTAASTLSGVVMQTVASDPNGGTAAVGVKVGLYLQPVHSGGPIAADPPQPIATVTTGAEGTFTFTGLKAEKRYFVFPMGARGYAIGRWAVPGQQPVRLTACTDCVMPL
jgi:hypothetical protein